MGFHIRRFFVYILRVTENIPRKDGNNSMPSAKILAQKQVELDSLVEKIKSSKAGVLIDYKGITVDQDTEFRKALRKAGVDYHVYKNTMTSRACDVMGFEAMKAQLEGMTALAISGEEIAAAKVVKEFADKIEALNIKAGYIDGEVIDAKGVEELAAIPSKEGLIAKLLGSIQSPLYGLAYVLQAKIDKDSAAEAPAAEAPAAE